MRRSPTICAGHRERLLGAKLPRGVLKRDRAQQPRVEHAVALGQRRFDALLERPLGGRGQRGTD